MEQHRGAGCKRQPGERVLQLFAARGTRDHGVGLDRVVVVVPPFLDLVDEQLTLAPSGPVDGEVVQHPHQPVAKWRVVAELVAPLDGADHDVVDQVVGEVRVTGHAERVPVQRVEMIDEVSGFETHAPCGPMVRAPRSRSQHRPP